MSESKTNKAALKTARELEKLKIDTPEKYIDQLHKVILGTRVTFAYDHGDIDQGIDYAIGLLKRNVLVGKGRLMIIGNGGSAAMAMHMLMDYANVAGVITVDFMNPALLTCMANDYGYENVFAKPIEIFANRGDVLFAISSSGQSKNILKACDAAMDAGCAVITFSGMRLDNPLRQKGSCNFYVPSTHYGFVELAHETLLNAILDLLVKGEDNVD